jgi:hypothetical protein
MPDKKVIIACYGFPPRPGIGGRRWAKFAKHLALNGWQIHVIQAKYKGKLISSWEEDVQHPAIKRHPLPINYPLENSGKQSQSLWQKIRFRFLKTYYELIQNKRIYDTTFLWEEQYNEKLSELITQEKITNVIVTGAPFYIMYYAAKLKSKRFKDLNLVCDFRDPWLGSVHYGINALSGTRLIQEHEFFNLVFEQSNYLLSAHPNTILEMFGTLGHQSNPFAQKCFEFPHAYDIDDISPFLSPVNSRNTKIKLIYAGTIYFDTDSTLHKLSDTLNKLKLQFPELYEKIQIDFYTDQHEKKEIFICHNNVVFFHQSIGKEIFKVINESNAILLILANHNKNARTTKFFEFIPFRKPYIVLGAKGKTSEFVETHNLGIYIQEDMFSDALITTIQQLSSGSFNFNNKFEIANYSYESQTKRLIDLLNQ